MCLRLHAAVFLQNAQLLRLIYICRSENVVSMSDGLDERDLRSCARFGVERFAVAGFGDPATSLIIGFN